ncbi:MAG: methionyl-tRNA formyltransferase [Isosphaeraceae bacterium]|jgi:methionyl-tRNA formyltransferase|nr:MAG: methionyl-tRNA formyltransferase [Isosphaeraceae bacterium]
MNVPELRLVMVGTKDFAVPTFVRLLDEGFTLSALITQPERPQGRDQILIPSRIKTIALERGIPVLQPPDINDPAFLPTLQTLAPDLLVTAAYGQILSASVLATARLGGINLHGSLLPAYRGAAPVARAIQHGETVTGVTVIHMTPRVDAGDILAIASTPIDPEETAGELETRLAQLGAPLVAQTIRDLAAGRAAPIPQDPSRVSKAPKLTKAEGRIDWALPARSIHNLVRAMQPWPTASTEWVAFDSPRRLPLIVHRTQPRDDLHGSPGQVLVAAGSDLVVAAGTGAVALLTIQTPGKKPTPVDAFLRGHRDLTTGRFQ